VVIGKTAMRFLSATIIIAYQAIRRNMRFLKEA
jgi:hypothetical protein